MSAPPTAPVSVDVARFSPAGDVLPTAAAHRLHVRLSMLSLPRSTTKWICNKALCALANLRTAPESYVLNSADAALNGQRASAFLAAFAASAPNKQWWLAKPADGQQSNGIVLFNDEASALGFTTGPLAMQQRVHGRPMATRGELVLQRYVAAPMLLDGAKFDLRLHVVVVAGGGGRTRTLLHRTSNYARVAAAPYSTDDANLDANEARIRHLTNFHSDGSWNDRRVPLADVFRQLASNSSSGGGSGGGGCGGGGGGGGDGTPFDADVLWQRIREPVVECMRVLEPRAAERPGGSFVHLFGLDVMLDTEARGWLLEANAVPLLNLEMRVGDRALVADMARVAVEEGYGSQLGAPACTVDDDAVTAWEELCLS